MRDRTDKKWPLEGRAAEEFRDIHLVPTGEPDEHWRVPYVDRETGERYLMEYPDADYHGGGVPRLRRVGA